MLNKKTKLKIISESSKYCKKKDGILISDYTTEP
jgi:hypothetical protein